MMTQKRFDEIKSKSEQIIQDAQSKVLAIQAVAQMRGDDLYRAQMAFNGMSEDQMQEQHGQSGRTRAEILKGYQDFVDKCDTAIKWLNSL